MKETIDDRVVFGLIKVIPVQSGLEPTQPPVKWVPSLYAGGKPAWTSG